MVEKTNVTICDRCNIRVATRTCFICGDDLCNFCRGKSDHYLEGIRLKHLVDCCKKCQPIMKKIIEDSPEEIMETLRKTLTIQLRKRLVLDKLEEKEVK